MFYACKSDSLRIWPIKVWMMLIRAFSLLLTPFSSHVSLSQHQVKWHACSSFELAFRVVSWLHICLSLQKGAHFYSNARDYWADQEVYSLAYIHVEEYRGFLQLSLSLTRNKNHLLVFRIHCFTILLQSISSNVSGFTGDEATALNLKMLIKSLSRLL